MKMTIENEGGTGGGQKTEARGLAAGREGRGLAWAEDVEPWEEAVDGQALLDELAGLMRRFVVLPKWGAETLALWVMHTYAFELRDVSTYVGIESPEKRCGKTTLLSVLSELVNRPVVASNISSPAFFRVIEEVRPTLLIDEADTMLRGNEELRGILNAGYGRKTAFVVRVTPEARSSDGGARNPEAAEGGSRLVKFSCWCPKAIAAIGRLPETLADRCIVMRMQRKTPKEGCERLRNLETTALKRQCARFVKDHSAAIATARPEIPGSLNDRAADIWEPLLALAELAGGEWPERARQGAASLTASVQESNPMGSLLFDIFLLFTMEKSGRLFSRALVEGLNDFVDRPWMELKRGKEVTELWLAHQLRPYGVRPRSMRIGEERAKGYFQDDFMEVFRRYMSRSEVEAFREDHRSSSAEAAEGDSRGGGDRKKGVE
jgi:hypothetical protein